MLLLVEHQRLAMADRDGTSAAKRRRERRLRAAWKHEQLSVAMALAAATHHSAPRDECRVPNESLRGLLAALHGIEAFLVASESLRKLRSAVRGVVWSRRQPFANVGAVLSLLVVILPFALFGSVSGYFDAILLFGPLRSVGFIVFLEW